MTTDNELQGVFRSFGGAFTKTNKKIVLQKHATLRYIPVFMLKDDQAAAWPTKSAVAATAYFMVMAMVNEERSTTMMGTRYHIALYRVHHKKLPQQSMVLTLMADVTRFAIRVSTSSCDCHSIIQISNLSILSNRFHFSTFNACFNSRLRLVPTQRKTQDRRRLAFSCMDDNGQGIHGD